MQSIRRRLGKTSVLIFAATALACAGDGPSAPADAVAKESSQGTPASGGQSSSDTVAVGLAVAPGALALQVGASGTLTATLVNAAGGIVQLPTQALKWTSSNTAVATVSGAGVVAALAAGEATVSATLGRFSASAQVVVF